MVQANDEVIHSPILCWNTPTLEEGSAWIMAQIKRPVETEHGGQIPVRLRRRRTAYPRHRSMPEKGKCRATSGASIRGTSDISGPSRKKLSDSRKDEKAYKHEVRNNHLRLEECGDDDLLPQGETGKVF